MRGFFYQLPGFNLLVACCCKVFNLTPQSEEFRLRLVLARLQYRNVFLVCRIGLLQFRNSITEFRYCFWVFIHGLIFGYALPRDGQSDAKTEVLSNAKKVDGPGALHDPVNPCQNHQNPNTQSKSSGGWMSALLFLLCFGIGTGGFLPQLALDSQHSVPHGCRGCQEVAK